MSAAATYAKLRHMGARIVTTGEAAAVVRTSLSAASRSLRDLEGKGLIRRVRQGLWVIGDEQIDPRVVIAELTRPFPAYISFDSALATHGAIDQSPTAIAVASLAKPRRVATDLGTYVVHQLPPQLFGGFVEREGYALATVEKAIFDYFYVACASGHPTRRLPELDLPEGSSQTKIQRWIERIASPRLRTLVSVSIARSVAPAGLSTLPSPRRSRRPSAPREP